MAELLRFDRVEISYDEYPAVRDVNMTLHEGEILAVVGESGSGKSTLIRAAMGLLGTSGKVAGGDIRYKGKSLLDLPEEERRRINGPEIGMIFQDSGSSFCPVRTIGSQLYESMTSHQAVTKKDFENTASDLLQKLGFEDGKRILKSYPFELSGGMQQRAGIAAAMLLKPAVLLADEPTSALDVFAQKQVVEEMLLLRRMFGTSIILVTHNIGVAGAMADNVLVLKDGRVAEYGETQKVFSAPQSAYTKKLMAAVPRLRLIGSHHDMEYT